MAESASSKQTKLKEKLHSMKQRVKAIWGSKKGKVAIILCAFVLVVVPFFFVPGLRHYTFGQLVKKDVSVAVVDSVNKQPVVDATVEVDGRSAKTGIDGVAVINAVTTTPHTISVSKPHFASVSRNYVVPFFTASEKQTIEIEATGQPIAMLVSNAVTGELLADATVVFGESTSKTNKEGEATIVLPYKSEKQVGEVAKDGYTQQQVSVTTNREVAEQSTQIGLAPSGQVMYLSKETGTINVMRANLDGTNDEIIVKGTGGESDYGTVLLSARDWKYAALLSRRDGVQDKLYLVDKESGKLTLIDQGEVYFTLDGWTGHKFVYRIERANLEGWEPKQSALKMYDADAGSLKVVNETEAFTEGADYGRSSYAGVYILDEEVVYATSWFYSNRYSWEYYGSVTKNAQLVSVNPDSYETRVVKSFAQRGVDTVSTKLYEPQGVYVEFTKDNDYDNPTYYEYEDGKVEPKLDVTPGKFGASYPTYLISPTGGKSFWYDERNGKNTLFIGDKYGRSAKKIADQSVYKPYGWFGSNDQYVLVSKDGSELYVASIDKLQDKNYKPLKISNYHKPRVDYRGYGYGYGGQ